MIETEREYLGVCIADPSLLGRDLGKYFTTASLRRIYESMVDLLEAGDPINAVTIGERIEPDSPGSTLRISELIQYPMYTRQRFLDREASDCLSRMKENYYRNQIASRCGDRTYGVDDIRADLAKIDVRREVHVGKSVAEGMAALESDLSVVENVMCGFGPIDDRVGGFRRGELVTFMARPSIGKTFIFLNIVHYLRTSPLRLGFFSLEMPLSGITERLMQIHDDAGWRSITLDYLRFNDHTAFKSAYKNLSIHTRVYSVAEMSRLIADEKDDVVFIDFLGLIKPSREFKSFYERVSSAFIELKAMAKERNIVVFLAVQLSRMGGDGTVVVKMDSARDSGQVEELSDFIVGCWRPMLYDETLENRAKLAMSLEKNKRGDVVTRMYDLKTTGRIVGVPR